MTTKRIDPGKKFGAILMRCVKIRRAFSPPPILKPEISFNANPSAETDGCYQSNHVFKRVVSRGPANQLEDNSDHQKAAQRERRYDGQGLENPSEEGSHGGTLVLSPDTWKSSLLVFSGSGPRQGLSSSFTQSKPCSGYCVMMLLLDRSIRMLCLALLLAAALMASFGPVTRSGSPTPIVTSALQSAAEVTGSHPRCLHVAEHSHDLLASMQDDLPTPKCANTSLIAYSDRFLHQTTVNPLEHPPRA
ncbi:hypothetical protein [Rhizobium rhizoryzae]|uniref:hypothetical protein n=1 Tax=Rhizobium rhizoryzae TaxID=451876 RepID=UPI0028B20E95|nr:hypothetical protein [Rhizobium rhizoryzae]